MAKLHRGVVEFNRLPEDVIEQVIFFLAPSRARSGCLYWSARISTIRTHHIALLDQLKQINALGKVCREFKRCLLKLPFAVRVMFRLEVPVVDTLVFKFDIHADITRLFGWSGNVRTLQVTSAPKSELVAQALAFILSATERIMLNVLDIQVPTFSNFRSLPPCDSGELLAQGIGRLDLFGVSPIPGNLVCLQLSLKPGKLLYFVSAATTWVELRDHRAFAISAQHDLSSHNELIAEGNPRVAADWFVLLLVPVEYIGKMKAANLILTEEERFGGSYKCDLTGRREFPEIESKKISYLVNYYPHFL